MALADELAAIGVPAELVTAVRRTERDLAELRAQHERVISRAEAALVHLAATVAPARCSAIVGPATLDAYRSSVAGGATSLN